MPISIVSREGVETLCARLFARRSGRQHFMPVVQRVFASFAPTADDGAPLPDVLDALTEFETWYRETHQNPFWMLFENQMPDTPLVDF